MKDAAPKPKNSPDSSFVTRYARIWNVISYLMLTIGVILSLADPQLPPLNKLAVLGLAAGWGLWYYLIVMRRSWYDRESPVMVGSFFAAMAVSMTLSWIQPAFLFICFAFYGLAFASLVVRWAIPLVIVLSLALAWRIAGLSGGLDASSLPIFASFGLSAFFTILLGLYINTIISQNREKQHMIDELEAARSELARAERQAGMLEERQRLAGEIHDTLAQGFTSVVMHLEAAEGALESDPAAARGYLDQARQAARQGLAEARRYLWALRPEVVARQPLAEALGRIGQHWSEESGIPFHQEVSGAERALPAPTVATFLRATQEALNNVRKHAQARQVTLTLTYMEDEVVLDVQDDGAGFDPAQIPLEAGPDHGYGLEALRERAAQLGGSLEVESAPGEGTTLVLSLPLSGE